MEDTFAFDSGRDTFVPPTLEITSMMDMFTIIVFFLLFAYSDKPQEITISEKINLPISISTKDFSNAAKIVISDSKIVVNDEMVATIIGENIIGIESGPVENSDLYKKLREFGQQARANTQKASSPDITGDDKAMQSVLLFCDEDLSYAVIQSVMKVAAMAGYPNFQLAVMNGQ